jgi:hypothetical protein
MARQWCCCGAFDLEADGLMPAGFRSRAGESPSGLLPRQSARTVCRKTMLDYGSAYELDKQVVEIRAALRLICFE